MRYENEIGITLIALVVTIVVLLILAGVSISMLTGENGIITQAQESKLQTEIGKEKEEVNLAYTSAKSNKENFSDLVTDVEMNEELDKLNSTGTASGSVTITVTFESGRQYTINQETGEISGPESTLTDDDLKEIISKEDGDCFIDEHGNVFSTDKYNAIVTDENSFSILGNRDNEGYFRDQGYYGEIIDGKLEYEIPVFLKQGGTLYRLTEIGDATFYMEYQLKSIEIPKGVISIGSYAFSYCSSLTNITIPNSVTSIGYSAFGSCNSLTNITIPNSVTSIGSYAFSDCSSLTNITIPDSITSIEYGTFSDCSSLTNITIPKSVTSIGWSAFSVCDNLTTIYYKGTEEQWKQITIDSGNESLTNAEIKYNQ